MSFHSTANNHEEPSFGDWGPDEASFELFFKKLYPGLCIYCKVKFGFDIYQAEDIVNSAFIKLWQVRETIPQEMAAKSYLYKTIQSNSLNILKHQKVVDAHARYLAATLPEEGSPTGFDSLDLKQLRETIDIAIAELPEQMRRIFELSRIEGLKYAEIASRLEISVKTVETQMSRALSKLRDKLSGHLISVLLLIFNLLMNM